MSKIKNIDSNLKTTLIEILDEAVDFNYRHNITGVLYYGHGYFVQCLEGTKTAIDDLFYNSIVKDERHVNCEILYYIECEDKFFSQWSMKFSPINQNITDFFMKYHLEEFNPYLLTAETVEKFVAVLAGEPEYDIQAYVS